MKFFNKKLILAAIAGAMIVFATGCTKKPSRPTPDQTVVNTDSNYTQGYNTQGYTTTNTSSSSQAYPAGGSTGTYVAPNFGSTSVFPAVNTTTTQDTVSERSPTDGTLNGNELRNISTLPPVLFDFDQSAIKRTEFSKVQAVKDYLAKNPTQRVLFEGHCDWRGTAEYNMALGDRRATAVKNYAIRLGIPANKIETRSVGSSNAVERGTESQMAQDRRAEIVILVK